MTAPQSPASVSGEEAGRGLNSSPGAVPPTPVSGEGTTGDWLRDLIEADEAAGIPLLDNVTGMTPVELRALHAKRRPEDGR